MAEVRLDRSRYFSECHGDRNPDDPTVRVAYYQGGRMGGKMILLPFDIQGNLVPDDGRRDVFQGRGLDSQGRQVMVDYHPLYTDDMRAFLAAKLKKVSAQPVKSSEEIEEDGDPSDIEEDASHPEDLVDFKAWLRGEVKYQTHVLRAAVKKQYHRNIPLTDRFRQTLVNELVEDEKLVPAKDVCKELSRLLIDSNASAA